MDSESLNVGKTLIGNLHITIGLKVKEDLPIIVFGIGYLNPQYSYIVHLKVFYHL